MVWQETRYVEVRGTGVKKRFTAPAKTKSITYRIRSMTSIDKIKPTIARIWKGRTTKDKAEEYSKYLYEVGFLPLVKKALGAQMFREDRENETEFITISYWESVEAMSRFAGADPRKIHHLERDAEFLIELPKDVQILRIVDTHGDVD